jgi:hypothetical protein
LWAPRCSLIETRFLTTWEASSLRGWVLIDSSWLTVSLLSKRVFQPWHIVIREDLGSLIGMFVLRASFAGCIPEGFGLGVRGSWGVILSTGHTNREQNNRH